MAVPETSKKGPGYTIVPAKRPITVRDLLTHTAGVSYGDGPAKDLYKAAGLQGWFLADRPEPVGDVHQEAGRAALRRPAGREVHLRLQHRHPRLPRRGRLGDEPGRLRRRSASPGRWPWPTPPSSCPRRRPAAWPRSTASARTARPALVDDPGSIAYVKGPRTVLRRRRRAPRDGRGLRPLPAHAPERRRVGRRPHPQPEIGPAHDRRPPAGPSTPARGNGFGLGFWVTKELGRNGEPGSVGAFGWGGAYHTTYWVDPAEKLVAVFMTQLLPATGSDAQAKFKALVYQSIVESYERR
ncbi:MAG: beta-lactamase family protein [Anaerotruncus sp.]|nr:beta-lactamase family protein [Anaerotruncus sp.]